MSGGFYPGTVFNVFNVMQGKPTFLVNLIPVEYATDVKICGGCFLDLLLSSATKNMIVFTEFQK